MKLNKQALFFSVLISVTLVSLTSILTSCSVDSYKIRMSQPKVVLPENADYESLLFDLLGKHNKWINSGDYYSDRQTMWLNTADIRLRRAWNANQYYQERRAMYKEAYYYYNGLLNR